jgi:hypothetical protein
MTAREAFNSRIVQWATLLIVLLIGAGFRIAKAATDTLTFDEMWHLELSTGRGSEHVDLPTDVLISDAPDVTSLSGARPWYSVWTHMSGVVHPPLFCLTLRIWRDIFGSSDAVARSLSILYSLIAIALMFFAAMQINGFTIAAWAALIFAVSPTQFWIGEQVRAYAMLQAMGMASVLALLRLEKSSTIQAALALGLCVLGMMLIHYFAISGAIAIAAYVCIRFRGKKLRLALGALAIAAVVYAIVWLPFMWKQRDAMNAANSWLMEPSPQHVILTFVRLAVWPWKSAVNYVGDQPWPYLSSLVLILPIFMLRRRPGLLLWYLWVWSTLGLLMGLDLIRGTKHLSLARYVSLAAPGMFVLLTAMLAGLPALVRHGLPAVVVIASVAFSGMWFSAVEEPGWRELGQIVDQQVSRSQVLMFYHGQGPEYLTDVYYLGAAHYSRQFPRTIVKLSTPNASLMQHLSNQTAWLITDPISSAQEILPGAKELQRIKAVDLGVCIEVQLPATP